MLLSILIVSDITPNHVTYRLNIDVFHAGFLVNVSPVNLIWTVLPYLVARCYLD